ncbi:MAG: tRNA (guanosine(46)-N7)-methyltransferase TrmB [Deltaproteobacteria bacterium]|nr:tRNA (guanosine(46)-N7)-methyltransferase TrmB [Deltaproteobacteria bacterium]
MSRTVRREIAGNDWRVWPEEVRREGWSALFGLPAAAPLRLHVDIGFGDGAFLIELARRDPGRSVVGIELSFKRVLKVAQRLSASDLRNVRLLGVDAAWAVREAFRDESVESFWINFPDPWPKRSHQRRRLVEPGFVRQISRRLMIGGSLHIATDSPDYAEAIRSALDGEPLLESVQAPSAPLDERRDLPPTRFQREWTSQGRACVFFHCRRAKALAASRMRHAQGAAS